MSGRIVSLTLRDAATVRETDAFMAALVTITHPELPQPIRISSDPSERLSIDPPLFGTVSRGNTFWHIPTKLVLPGADKQTAAKAQLMFDNIAIDRDTAGIAELANARVSDLALKSPGLGIVLIELVYSTTPDFVERHWPRLQTVVTTVEGASVVVDLARNNKAREPVPALTFSPAYFPGLF
jgi:hypothetical protein